MVSHPVVSSFHSTKKYKNRVEKVRIFEVKMVYTHFVVRSLSNFVAFSRNKVKLGIKRM